MEIGLEDWFDEWTKIANEVPQFRAPLNPPKNEYHRNVKVIANPYLTEALFEILIDKGIITKQELFDKLDELK